MLTVTLGTKNRDKAKEIQEILLGIPFLLAPLDADVPEAPEDAETLAGNAIQKGTP